MNLPRQATVSYRQRRLKRLCHHCVIWSLLPLYLSLRTASAGDAKTNLWSLQPLAQAAIPQVTGPAEWRRNPLDAFVVAKLQANRLSPAPATDRHTLIRRLSFDLVGLPPTPDEVSAFVNDRTPGAYERVVDRLLASPQHGERWARHWLDVVRFGESQGFEYDRIREHSWRYRDYVIASFNADKPYDRFVREQLAGDVLEPVTSEGVIATGFLVAGPWDQAGNSSASASLRAMVREAELEDIVGTVGQTFLGLTLNCARCHDHKFDPIPQRDYYRIKAVFQGVRHGERSLMTDMLQAEHAATNAARQAQFVRLEQRFNALEGTAKRRLHSGINPPDTNSPGQRPLPVSRWSFSHDARDGIGPLDGDLLGGSLIRNGRLQLDGRGGFLQTAPTPTPIFAKTLEAWVTLATTNQHGGGVITLELPDGSHFDALTFAERQPGKWMAGSEFYRRTRDLDATAEDSPPGRLIHLVLTYGSGRTVTLYRNGKPYGAPYVPQDDFGRFNVFPAGSRILIGRRHTGGSDVFLQGEVAEARLYDRALTAAEVAASFLAGPQAELNGFDYNLTALSEAERAERSRLIAERTRLLALLREPEPTPMTYAVNPEQPGATFVLTRGEPDKPRDPVTPGALTALATHPGELRLSADATEAERRRRFADWVTSPENPLTARVIVNRVWQHHFGRGIVTTPNDFGKMGDPPSHPELLDWLAAWFVAPDGANWSLKKLHKLVVTSEAYRQSSAIGNRQLPMANSKDADNRLLWRFPPRRLEAEEVRDTLLALGGELNPQMGGPGFRPFRITGNGNQNEYFAADLIGPEFNRRTIYRLSVHSARDPLLDALDCPEFSTRTPVRASTTTPLQALSLMNGSFMQRECNKLAAKVQQEVGANVKSQVKRLWLHCLAREPRADELRDAARLAHEQGMAGVAWALLNSNEFVFVR